VFVRFLTESPGKPVEQAHRAQVQLIDLLYPYFGA
jgi:hypothetical protein